MKTKNKKTSILPPAPPPPPPPHHLGRTRSVYRGIYIYMYWCVFILQPASLRPGRHEGYLAVIPEVQRALQRWRELDGVLLEPSDQNELASVVMLARCCADPPPVSTLGWSGSGGESALGAGEKSTAAGAVAVASVGGGGGGVQEAVGVEQGGAARSGVVFAAGGPGHAAVGLSSTSRGGGVAASPFPGFSVGEEASEGGADLGRVGASMSGVAAAGPGWLKRPVPRLDGERESRFRKVDAGGVDDRIDVGGEGGGPSRQVQI